MTQLKATAAEFERLADVLLDFAKTEYFSCTELSPKLVVMGLDPAGNGAQPYRFGFVPVEELMASAAGMPGEVVLVSLVEKLVQDPEVLVVGYIAEGWQAKFTPEERAQIGEASLEPEAAANREEVLLLRLHSSDQVALKSTPVYREGRVVRLGEGALLFGHWACGRPVGRYVN